MKVGSPKDLYSGLIFIAVAAVFGLASMRYELGKASEMGPGYFPLLLSGLLACIGLGLCAISLRGRQDAPLLPHPASAPWPWRAMAAVLGGVVLFAALLKGVPSLHLPSWGLVLSVYVLTYVTGLGGLGLSRRGFLLLASALAAFSYLVFIVILKLPMSAWPWFVRV